VPTPSIITDIYQGRARVTFTPGRHTYSIRVHSHIDKLFQPSVTGILGMKAKPALVDWAAKESLRCVEKKLGAYESSLGAPPFVIDTKEIHSWLAEAADGWREDEAATTIGTVAHRYAYEELRYRAGLAPKRPVFPIAADAVLMPDFTEAMVAATNSSALAASQFFDEHDFTPLLMERPLWSPQDGFVGTPDFIGYVDGELAVVDYKSSKRIYTEYRAQLAALQYMYQLEFRKVVKWRYAVNIPKDGSALQVERYGNDSFESDLGMFMNCWGLYRWNREHDDYSKGSPIQVLGDLDSLIARPTE
jgi:hypothetical protein